MKVTVKQFLADTILMVIGSALIAVAVNGFLKPHEFLSGGMAGISLIVFYHLPESWPYVPFGFLYLILSIPIFFFGYFIVGRKFILYSIWAVLIHTAMFLFVIPEIVIPDKLLSALVAGVLSGAGMALILRTNGTHSGTEIISIIINKFYSINLSTTNMAINATLMIFANIFMPFESVLYSLVFVIMHAQVMNAVFKGLAKRKVVMVISKKWREILNKLNRERKMGVTLLSAKGGYTGSEEPILYSIIKSRHVNIIRKVATSIDPMAFIVIMEASDIVNDTVGNQPPWKKLLYNKK